MENRAGGGRHIKAVKKISVMLLVVCLVLSNVSTVWAASIVWGSYSTVTINGYLAQIGYDPSTNKIYRIWNGPSSDTANINGPLLYDETTGTLIFDDRSTYVTYTGGIPVTKSSWVFSPIDGHVYKDRYIGSSFTYHAPPVPSAPTGLSASKTAADSVRVAWTANPAGDGVTSYNVYDNGVKIGSSTNTSYIASGLSVGGHAFQVTAVNNSGESQKSTSVAVSLGVPAVPSGVNVSGSGPNGMLTWVANPASDYVTSYKVYDNGSYVTSVTGTNYSFSASVGAHSFTITAVNSLGESGPSSPVAYIVLGVPGQVTGVSVMGSGADSGIITWQASPDSDQVQYYNVYDNSAVIASPTSNSYSFSGLPVGVHAFQVSAVNSTGEGPLSSIVNYTIKPSAPTGLSAGSITATSFTVYWLRQSDADSYNVYLDGNLIGNVSQTLVFNPSYNFTGFTSGSSHTVTVTTVYQGIESAQSQPLTVVLVPSAPTGLEVSNVTAYSADLSWSVVTGATGYAIYEDGNQIATTTGTSYVVTGLSPNTAYSFQVAAINSTGESELSNALDVTTSDVPAAPPEIPSGLSAGKITSSSFTVYWLKQSDASSYNVYLDGTLLGNVRKPLIYNPSYDVTGLQPGTTHTITVTALNAAGESQPSLPLTVTTTVPVPVLKAKVDGQNINLSWINGVGNSFSILVNGKQVAQTTGSPYTLTEQPGTYQVQVIQNYNGQQYPSNVVTVTISALKSVGSGQMASDVFENLGLVMVPVGGLLALALGIKASPLLIGIIKSGVLGKWLR